MMELRSLASFTFGLCFHAHHARADQSVARQWNEENLAAIRIDVPHPPVHARNLFHVAVAMYDAWAAYDPVAIGYIHHERAIAADTEAARHEAISYAAYRILSARFANSVGNEITLPALDARMSMLGYNPGVVTTSGASPAALGNRIAASILAWGLGDGSGEAAGYDDPSYVNDQPIFEIIENGMPLGGYPAGSDPDRWHPLTFDEGFAQNGVGPIFLQPYVGVTWLQTRPFSLRRQDPLEPWFDPGGPPLLRGGQAEAYRAEALDVLEKSRGLGAMDLIDISPAGMGNNPVGTDSGTGYPVNPSTGLPYPSQWVPKGDYVRVLAEYWADGPDSETPPGHWHSLANEVSDVMAEKRIGGSGPVVGDLEWDVKLYFALSAACHDAACAAWSLKRKYDSPRPISMIRFMSLQGQATDPGLPGYHPEGMPLVPGLVEVVTAESLEPGGAHAASGFPVGEVVVFTWPGRPEDPTVQRSLPRWIRGTDWFPYQDRTFVSPAFPGYISGHSTFSRAAAEVLAAITGSPYFPGTSGTFSARAGRFLWFEYGPSVTVNLTWATYFDAADEAGVSRRWGGIHPEIDDLPGRIIGQQCGQQVWILAPKYWNGDILGEAISPEVSRPNDTTAVVAWSAQPGFWYSVERSINLSTWSEVRTPIQAMAPETSWTDEEAVEPRVFYRVIMRPNAP